MRPFAHAQLIRINEVTLDKYNKKPSESLATVKKPVRLSWSFDIPTNNKVSSGTWWQPASDDWQQISVEEEVMTDLGLSLGDQLTFQVGGDTSTFVIKASHLYVPGNGSVTFWFQIPEKAHKALNLDPNYMGSMELPESAWEQLSDLWQPHPTLSLVPLTELTRRFDETLAVLTNIVKGFSGMVMVMAIIVLAASIKGFEKDERLKNGLLMSMGTSQSSCLKMAIMDWLIVAAVASVGAVVGTLIAGHLIYKSQFAMLYVPDIGWLTVTVLSIAFVVCMVGLITSRQSLRASIKTLITES